MTYISHQLEALRSAVTKAANPYYVKATDLRIRELRLLRLLRETPGCTATELKQRVILDKTLLSKNLASLEKKGLILRRPDLHDYRRQCLHLSEDGEKAWRKSEEVAQMLERSLFAELSVQEWETLQILLDRAFASVKKWEENNVAPDTPLDDDAC